MKKHRWFVALNAAAGESLNVYGSLKKHPEVVSIYLVAGVYDLMLMVETNTPEGFGDFVIEEVQKTKGVTHTTTFTALRGE